MLSRIYPVIFVIWIFNDCVIAIYYSPSMFAESQLRSFSSVILPADTATLWQRSFWRCYNVVARSKMRVVRASVSDVVTTSESDVSRRCHNVAATSPQHWALDFYAILLRTILISFPLSKRERVTKVLSGIKHTSSLFKRTLSGNNLESSGSVRKNKKGALRTVKGHFIW